MKIELGPFPSRAAVNAAVTRMLADTEIARRTRLVPDRERRLATVVERLHYLSMRDALAGGLRKGDLSAALPFGRAEPLYRAIDAFAALDAALDSLIAPDSAARARVERALKSARVAVARSLAPPRARRRDQERNDDLVAVYLALRAERLIEAPSRGTPSGDTLAMVAAVAHALGIRPRGASPIPANSVRVALRRRKALVASMWAELQRDGLA